MTPPADGSARPQRERQARERDVLRELRELGGRRDGSAEISGDDHRAADSPRPITNGKRSKRSVRP